MKIKKRRLLAFVLVIALTAGILLTNFTAGANGETLDIDNDGELTIHDAQLLTEADAGIRILSDRQKEAKGEGTVQTILSKIMGPSYTPPTTMPKLPEMIGDIQNESKISQDLAQRSISITQLDTKENRPSFTFYNDKTPLTGNQWAVKGTISSETVTNHSGHIYFTATKDSSNLANIIINRRVSGTNGIYQNITINGVREPAPGSNTLVSNDLVDSTSWSAEFVFMYYKGAISLYLKEPGEAFKRMTSINLTWGSCAPIFSVAQYANVSLSNLSMYATTESIKALYNDLEGSSTESKNLLFIGNSATSYSKTGIDIPAIFSELANQAGYQVNVGYAVKGSTSLAQHADTTTDHGQSVLAEIAKGYDIVFLQEMTSCILTEDKGSSTLDACRVLDAAIRESGAETYLYVRPPMKKDDSAGNNTYTQCVKYDTLFTNVANEIGASNVYVNRAFAYAVENLDLELWSSDDAHVNETGAYLIACVFFSTLFNESATVLDNNGLDEDVATALQQAADKVVFENYIPQ